MFPKLLDRLIYKEIAGPWLFGVAMFSVVLMAGTYLFRLTDFLVKGVDPADVVKLSILYMPGLVAKTFPMAVLLAALLAFARLSNDSEIIAAQTGGASTFRIMRPVALFGLVVSGLSFVFNEFVVPPASLRATELTASVLKKLKQSGGQPYSQPLYLKGVLRGNIFAKDIDLSTGTMKDVTATWWGTRDEPDATFYFHELYYTPGKTWLAKGIVMTRTKPNGEVYTTRIDVAQPPFGEALDFTPETLLASSVNDYDALSLGQLQKRIERLRGQPKKDEIAKSKLRDMEVGYWTKFSLPLTAFVFALVGAPVSIRRVRQSVGIGIGLSIAIIFGYYLLYSYLNVLAKGGKVGPAISAFLPALVGFAAAIVLIIRKNH